MRRCAPLSQQLFPRRWRQNETAHTVPPRQGFDWLDRWKRNRPATIIARAGARPIGAGALFAILILICSTRAARAQRTRESRSLQKNHHHLVLSVLCRLQERRCLPSLPQWLKRWARPGGYPQLGRRRRTARPGGRPQLGRGRRTARPAAAALQTERLRDRLGGRPQLAAVRQGKLGASENVFCKGCCN